MSYALLYANRLAAEGERSAAALVLSEVLQDELRADACTSLGVLVSEGLDPATLETCWKRLGGWSALERQAEEMGPKRFAALAVLVELALAVEATRARRFIAGTYVPHLRRHEIIRPRDTHTILVWHVPKCGGTALNACLAHAFYRSGLAMLPSYTARVLQRIAARAHRSDPLSVVFASASTSDGHALGRRALSGACAA